MQYEERNGTVRGSPSGRYGVSPWRCATQPQAVRLSNVRAQPTSALGNSCRARVRPAPQPWAGIASASRKTTTGLVAAAQPAFRAPPADFEVSFATTVAPAALAASAVPSFDASSTTMLSAGAGVCARRA